MLQSLQLRCWTSQATESAVLGRMGSPAAGKIGRACWPLRAGCVSLAKVRWE